MHKQKSIFSTIFLVLIGLGMIASSFWLFYRDYRLNRFVKSTCTILSKQVSVHTRTNKGRTTYSYSPYISYTYKVKDKQYTSNRYYIGSQTGSKFWAENVCAQYSVSGESTCWYDPSDPQTGVLSREKSHYTNLFILLGGILMFILGIAPEKKITTSSSRSNTPSFMMPVKVKPKKKEQITFSKPESASSWQDEWN